MRLLLNKFNTVKILFTFFNSWNINLAPSSPNKFPLKHKIVILFDLTKLDINSCDNFISFKRFSSSISFIFLYE